jgi:signal transduction histidine kinase
MLENLTGNAVKYGAKSSPIRVVAIRKENWVELSVNNAGKKIPEAELKALFQQYHRTEEATKSGQKGWGIGLTLVQGFAEAHGGSVSVTSTSKAGTTFTIRLPLDCRELPPKTA